MPSSRVCSAENGRRLAGMNLTSTPTEALPPRQKSQIVRRSHNREFGIVSKSATNCTYLSCSRGSSKLNL
ncbi:hypothetical protein QQF64_032313 [Cirrhinus molitorella]|uniref:Uncharacterized protein n=1 Tax=Cirrhinus molitorella TaxID=172907 RepID=A0ABR3MZG4_9TELE